MSYNSFRNDNNGAGEFALIQFRKSNNFASVANLDLLGQILWSGYDATTSTYKSASYIYCQAVGAPAANVPSELQFNTSFGTGTQLAMTIGQNGQVSISDPAANETTLVVVNNQTSPNINLRTANATATNSPHVHFTRSRAGTADVQASDDLGRLEFRGFQGGTAIEAADIRAQAQTVNGASVSGSLQFRTRPTTYAAINTRMNISADGNVTINAPVSGDALTATAVAGSLAASFAGSNAGGVSVTQPNGGSSSYQAVQSSVDVQPVYFNAFKNRAGGIIVANDVIYQLTGFGFADANRVAALQRIFSTNIGANYVSGGFDWWTTSTAGATNQRMIIGAEGNVTINAPVSGIALNIVAGGETITAGDLTLTAGNINLSTTSATSGIVNVNATRFMHAYGTNNTFLGSSAGNFTLTATQATAIGASAGNNITTGGNSVYIGYQAGNTVSGGNENVVIGAQAFASANASQNVVIGYRSGYLSTGFTACTLVGKFTLDKANTGLYNLMLGYGSGTNYTGTESSNICLHSDGVLGDNNTLRIGQSTGTGNRQIQNTYIQGYVNLPGTPSFHAYIGSPTLNATGDGTNFDVIFGVERYDVSSSYTAATGVFTAPVTGKYMFTSQLIIEGLTAGMTSGLYGFLVNGFSYVGGVTYCSPYACALNSSFFSIQNTAIFACTAGDTVQCRVQVNGGAKVCDFTNQTANFFAGQLLS